LKEFLENFGGGTPILGAVFWRVEKEKGGMTNEQVRQRNDHY
jgi:hypothetical protein